MVIPSNCKPTSSYVSLDLRDPVKVRLREGDSPPTTVPQFFESIVQRIPNRPALKSQNRYKKWVSLSYQEYRDKSRQLARAFIKLGLEPRTSCSILAIGCPEWFISQMATIMVGGVVAGIYMTNSAEACEHILLNSNATICVVDDSIQMLKIRSVKHRLPMLRAVIQIHGPFADFVDSEEGYFSWTKVEAIGAREMGLEQEVEKRLNAVAANECAMLIYTSGTVGMPKGVMISHDNILVMSENVVSGMEEKVFGHEVIVSYLPLNHVAGQLLEFFNALSLGACVYFADRNALKGTLLNTMAEVHPTRFFGVPRIYEKIAEKLMTNELEMPLISRLVVKTAHKVVKSQNIAMMGSGSREIQGISYFLASKIIDKVLASIGFDKCKSWLIGAASSTVELKEYLLGYNVKLNEMYGLSEASGCVTVNWEREEYKSCGKAQPIFELKLDKTDQNGHGEICVRGRTVFMGYLGSAEQTQEALKDDGWLHTGDIGYLDVKGRIHISGRLKELIVTSGGENIPPVRIENLVKNELPGISNAMLVGDSRKYLTILLSIKTVIDPDSGTPTDLLQSDAIEWLRTLDLPYSTLSELLDAGPCPKVLQSIQEGLDRANAKAISNAQRVQKFAILPHDFSIKTGELGPTLKLRRNVVLRKYADVIESLYKAT